MVTLPTTLMDVGGVGTETCEAWEELRMERVAPVSSKNLMATPEPGSKPKPTLESEGFEQRRGGGCQGEHE